MAHHDHSHGGGNTNLDPQQVKDAHNMWHGFTHLSKISIIGIIAVLVLMAVFLT